MTTVFSVLEQSISLQENELRQKSLEFIWTNPHLAFGAEDFLYLFRNVLEEVICADSLTFIEEKAVQCISILCKIGNTSVTGVRKKIR